MITTEGIKVIQKQTDHQKCNSCLYGNPFNIEVKREGSQWYYLTKCPRCGRYDECKEIAYRRAQEYITLPELQ